MRSIVAFVKCRPTLAAVGVLVILCLEGGYIWSQQRAQESLLSALTEPGAVAGSVIVTTSPVDRNPFYWRDIVTVTVGASVWNQDSSAVPVTFEFEIESRFTPLGLEGAVRPLSKLDDELARRIEGTLPELVCGYEIAPFSRLMRAETTLAPFDFEYRTVVAGVGPVAWRFAAPQPLEWSLEAPIGGDVRSTAAVPEFIAQFRDPAGNTDVLRVTGASVKGWLEPKPFEKVEREWFLKSAENTAGRIELKVADWRGELSVELDDVLHRLSQEPLRKEAALDGDYLLTAKNARVALRNARLGGRETGFEAEDFNFKTRAKNLPVALMQTLDEEHLEEVLRAAGVVSLNVDDFSFKTRGLPVKAEGFLIGSLSPEPEGGDFALKPDTTHERAMRERRVRAGEALRPGDEATLRWRLHLSIPEHVMAIGETLLKGERRGLPDPRLFFRPEKTKKGTLWNMEFEGDIEHGATLNGEALGMTVTRRWEETPEGFRPVP